MNERTVKTRKTTALGGVIRHRNALGALVRSRLTPSNNGVRYRKVRFDEDDKGHVNPYDAPDEKVCASCWNPTSLCMCDRDDDETATPSDNLPVMVTVGESGYEPEGSEHVAFYDSGRWYYQDTAEHFKAPVVSWRELTEEEGWNV